MSEVGTTKVRVVHVITRFDKGGSAENMFLTVRDLDKQRYDVSMVLGLSQESLMGDAERSAIQKNLAEAKQAGINIRILPNLVRNIRPLKDLSAFFSLIRIFWHINPQIVHTHTSKAGLLGRWAAWLTRVPIIIHTPHGHVFWGYFSDPTTKLFMILERIAAQITDRLIMLTHGEKEDHLRFRIAPEHKLSVIHSGVDFRSFENQAIHPRRIRQRLGIPTDSFLIGSVGRLTQVKGHRHLLEALAVLAPRLKNLSCVLLGDGELRHELETLTISLGIRDQVFFLGWRSDVAAVVSIFDIFAFPSLNEGMGKALVEAMSMGKPVIASAVGGIRDLVISGENGILIPPGNVEILVKSIELLYQNKHLRQRMGEDAQQKSILYSSHLMVQQIEALYASLST